MAQKRNMECSSKTGYAGSCWALWVLAMSVVLIVKVLGLPLSSDTMQSGRAPEAEMTALETMLTAFPGWCGEGVSGTTGLDPVLASGLLSNTELPEARSELKPPSFLS